MSLVLQQFGWDGVEGLILVEPPDEGKGKDNQVMESDDCAPIEGPGCDGC